ncbi:WD40 repeat-like protein [Xylariaceae sp. AK1471]|nr:WD40 repeat-like protein [Xylariaceae sp. AK1471]
MRTVNAMQSYSSRQFYQDWRYAIAKDFTTSSGEPYPYADGGKQEWGDEVRKLVFDNGAAEPDTACVSSDGSRLAVAARHTIYIVDTATWEVSQTIRGHTSEINALAFKPGDANVLVSCQDDHKGSEPTIFVWRLDETALRKDVPREILKSVSGTLAKDAVAYLGQAGVNLLDADRQQLEKLFEPAVTRVVDQRSAPARQRFEGRLQRSFQANLFSPSGKWMVYLPGKRPRSNDIAPWHMVICSTDGDEFSQHIKLEGHTDAIMWTGWSPDEKLFGSVAWDRTMRIWDADTGEQVYEFETNGQNWTGGFSPDSKLFVGTCGQGTVHVYDLTDGSTKWVYDGDGRKADWQRALDWHPNGRWLAVGGQQCATLVLLDVEEKKVIQERQLSLEAARPDREEARRSVAMCLEVGRVRFVDEGNKLALWTKGDSSMEVFDITREVKWRFARGGTDPQSEEGEWIDENGKVTSKGGHGMVLWDDKRMGETIFVSVDFDGLRVWTVKGT